MKLRLFLLIVAAVSFSYGCTSARPWAGSTARPQTEIQISRDGISSAEPAVARDETGTAFVVYVEHTEKNADVILQKLDASGRAVDDKVRVNPIQGEATAWKGDPPTIAVANDNTIFVGWTRRYGDGEKGTDLMVSVSRDGGRSFAESVKVNDDQKPASHGMHSLAVARDGRVFVAWLDERNVKPLTPDASITGTLDSHLEAVEPNSEVFYSYSTDGGRTFSQNQRIAENVCPCCKTSLLAAADGAVYAAWRQVLEGDHRHIAVASSTDAGVSFGKGVIVSDDRWKLSACPVSGAALASPAEGTLDVLWYTAGEAGQAGIYFARSTDAGKAFGGRLLVSNESSGGTPTLISRDGRSVALFASKDGGLVSAEWSGNPAQSMNVTRFSQAKFPAAVDGLTVFVRESGGKSAVWAAIDKATL